MLCFSSSFCNEILLKIKLSYVLIRGLLKEVTGTILKQKAFDIISYMFIWSKLIILSEIIVGIHTMLSIWVSRWDSRVKSFWNMKDSFSS